MKLTRISVLCFTASLLLFSINARAGVDFDITPNGEILGPSITFADISKTETDIKENPDRLINANDKVIAYGLALSNTIGYPNGKSIIPNFEFGAALGAAVYQYDRYEDFDIEDDPEIPGGGVNAAFHFGLGLTERTDVAFKIFLNKGFYAPDKNITEEGDENSWDVTFDETDLVTLGIKGRYNLVQEVRLIPFLLSFGGVTAGVAVDYTHGRISSSAIYKDTRNVDFDVQDSLSGETYTQTASIETTVKGHAGVEWDVLSVTPEIMTYVDLFYLFSIYTGPAVTFNAGAANISMSADGALQNKTAIYADQSNILRLVDADETIATGRLRANVPLDMPIAVPLWKAGLEINLMALKIQAEAATVLTSPANSFTAQLGLRMQF